MDIAIAGMIFSLLCLLIIGGIILMYPVTRRLGELLEQRLEERRAGLEGAGAEPAELRELRSALYSLEGEVARLSERQRFVEGLLESGEPSGERSRELSRP